MMGGNAPYGGSGGRGTVYTNFDDASSATNCNFPGGGGGGSGASYDTPTIKYACNSWGGTGITNGGDGLINIYF